MKPHHDPIACQIIDGLGGSRVVANLCEIELAAVSNWRSHGVPKARLQFLKLARPDFDWGSVPTSREPFEQQTAAA